MNEDDLDLEFAIDQIFRAANGIDRSMRNLTNGDSSGVISVMVCLEMAKNELERRGWVWRPGTQPTVTREEPK